MTTGKFDYSRGGGPGKDRKRSDELGFGGYVISPLIATMKTFIKTLTKKPRTVLYPYEDTDTPEFWGKGHYWRGMHKVDWSRCIGCALCSRSCPNQCITMEVIPEEEAGKWLKRSNQDEKKKKVDRPGVDIGRCSFCGYCQEVCPTQAWKMTNRFDLANKDRSMLRVEARKLKSKERKGKGKAVNRVGESPIYNYDKCKGCQACIRQCSARVIDLVDMGRDENKKLLRRIYIHYDDCIGCGACVAACKFNSLCMELKEQCKNDPRVISFLKNKKE